MEHGKSFKILGPDLSTLPSLLSCSVNSLYGCSQNTDIAKHIKGRLMKRTLIIFTNWITFHKWDFSLRNLLPEGAISFL